MMRLSKARLQALLWFDKVERDPVMTFGPYVPSTLLRERMLADGQIMKEPVGQFNFVRYRLTEAGRALMMREQPIKRRRRRC
jgi:hypothetical protein